jgi:hypothetical protein
MGDPFRRVHWDNDGDFSDPTKREYPYDQALRAYSRYKIGDYRYSVVENDNPHRLHVIVYDG